MENLLVKDEKINFCKEEFAKYIEAIKADLNGVDDEHSKYKGLYPFDYKGHVEINKVELDTHSELLMEHLKYMKAKIRHDEANKEKR
ncbi:MAG: hypothetical protein MJZ02_07425 [Paludibacteraceae bacterium]|nr:hypothetical protein [Paludibacteraceae bacterium]